MKYKLNIIFISLLIIYFTYFYWSFRNTTEIIINYTEYINDKAIQKEIKYLTDIKPDKDIVKISNCYYKLQNAILIDTHYAKFIHPTSWKYISVNHSKVIITKAIAIYNDSIYNLKVN